MYITKKKYPAGTNEPVGTITEHVVTELYDNEIRDTFIEDMTEYQELLDSTTMVDTFSGTPEELLTCNYFTNQEIDILNEMFMECGEWTEQQIKYILERFTPNKEEENETN